MGMFDDIQCDYPLPLPEYQRNHFQTKSLHCTLSRYRITKDGRLVDGFAQEVPYDGDLYFYDIPRPGGWIEFRATFREGRVTELVEWKDEEWRDD